MRIAAVVLLVAGGCRSIVGIDEVAVDERVSNDEDGDAILDHRDNCPTITNETQVDGDRDLVGDACDPDLFVQNRIAFYSPILSEDGLLLGNTAVVGDGFAAIRGSQVTVEAPQMPTRIEAAVRFHTFNASETVTLEFDAGVKGVWQCYAGFKISACGGVDCLRFRAPDGTLRSINFPEAPDLVKLTIDVATNAGRCTATTDASLMRVLDGEGTGKTPGTVTISATGDAELYSLIVYE